MKRAHVLAVTFLAGFVAGVVIPAHAANYICEVGFEGSNKAPNAENFTFTINKKSGYATIQREGFSKYHAKPISNNEWQAIPGDGLAPGETDDSAPETFKVFDNCRLETYVGGLRWEVCNEVSE